MKNGFQVARVLAYVTGLVNQELLQVEYLAPRIEFCGRTRQRGCASQMLNAPLWARSANGSGARVWRKSRKSRNRRRLSVGSGSSSLKSSTVRSVAHTPADR
jgi:hypothetical protein